MATDQEIDIEIHNLPKPRFGKGNVRRFKAGLEDPVSDLWSKIQDYPRLECVYYVPDASKGSGLGGTKQIRTKKDENICHFPGSSETITVTKDEPSDFESRRINVKDTFLHFANLSKGPVKAELAVLSGKSSTTGAANPVAGRVQDCISVDGGELKITFHRTIRLPDDDKLHQLPASFGSFPLCSVSAFASRLPDNIVSDGGVFFPMWQREAMWIEFILELPQRRKYAIRPFIGKINVLTGKKMDEENDTGQQDYIVVPDQRWLDGICVEDGVVRQFVAMPLGSGYTVEGQKTGEEKFGGLQLEIIPMYDSQVTVFFHRIDRGRKEAKSDILPRHSPLDLNLAHGTQVRMKTKTTVASRPLIFSDLVKDAEGIGYLSSRRAGSDGGPVRVTSMKFSATRLPQAPRGREKKHPEASKKAATMLLGGLALPFFLARRSKKSSPVMYACPDLGADHAYRKHCRFASPPVSSVPQFQAQHSPMSMAGYKCDTGPYPSTTTPAPSRPWYGQMPGRQGPQQHAPQFVESGSAWLWADVWGTWDQAAAHWRSPQQEPPQRSRAPLHEAFELSGEEAATHQRSQQPAAELPAEMEATPLRYKMIPESPKRELTTRQHATADPSADVVTARSRVAAHHGPQHRRSRDAAVRTRVKAMGIAAGGKLVQDVARDRNARGMWNSSRSALLNVHILDPASFEMVTHVLPPPTPVDARAYASAGYPFYAVEEDVDNRLAGGGFGDVKSVSAMDGETLAGGGVGGGSGGIDPLRPRVCIFCSLRLCDCVLRPCNHRFCNQCIVQSSQSSDGGTGTWCPICVVRADRVVGFSAPMNIPGEESINQDVEVHLLTANDGRIAFDSVYKSEL